MCYSTCTFNPIENEAVVAEILRRSQGALELVDASDALPGLRRRPGLTTWTVFTHKMERVDKKNADAKLPNTYFPPSEAEVKAFHLERCIRCVPHDQDTGGFFICLLRKTANLFSKKSGSDDSDAVVAAENDANKTHRTVVNTTTPMMTPESNLSLQEKKAIHPKGVKDMYLNVESGVLKDVREFYGLSDTFPMDQLISKSSISKVLHYAAREISLNLLQQLQASRIKVVYSGCKVLVKCSISGSSCGYRMAQTGVHIMLPYISKRRLSVPREDFYHLLHSNQQEQVKFDKLSDSVNEALSSIEPGCLIICLEGDASFHLTAWRGQSSVMAMAAKQDLITLQAAFSESSHHQSSLTSMTHPS